MKTAPPMLIVLVALAGCSGRGATTASLPGVPDDALHRRAPDGATYKSLFEFAGGAGGLAPEAGLVELGGEFYGTTFLGGTANCGTVFKISASGQQHVLYSFQGGSDGKNPSASLVAVHGVLYGTTTEGGTGSGGGNGVVFSITTVGEEHVLHAFQGNPDGQASYGNLIEYKGKLYGTTAYGGTDGGTVFEIDTAGHERVVYAFGANPDDGSAPLAGLIDVGGTFYGTTAGGGGKKVAGTVFSVTPAGTEKVIYTFKAGLDGETPGAPLVELNGEFYGTTVYGGSSDPSLYNGVIFKVNAAGREKVLHRFQGESDGASPLGGLTAVNGTLYGTTYFGGDGTPSFSGNGTIYSVTTAGVETILHDFQGEGDGSNPEGNLIALQGSLYGTSSQQGLGQANGNGNVFSLTP